MTQQNELILRVKAKKKELEADLERLKNNISSGAKTHEDDLKKKIVEISDDIKHANKEFTEAVAKKINRWLKP
jgi:dGTP triphosphohydrolase